MPLREVVDSGRQYLDRVTALLPPVRRGDPGHGLWGAGDRQWWWRRPRLSDDAGQLSGMDDTGPVAAVGLGRHLRTAGLDGLTGRGCQRIKVSYLAANTAARMVPLGAGFRPEVTAQVHSPVVGLPVGLGRRA